MFGINENNVLVSKKKTDMAVTNLIYPVNWHPLMFCRQRFQSLYDLTESCVKIVVGYDRINIFVVGPLQTGTILQGPFQVFFLEKHIIFIT